VDAKGNAMPAKAFAYAIDRTKTVKSNKSGASNKQPLNVCYPLS